MKHSNKLLSLLLALLLCLSVTGGLATTSQALEQTEVNHYYLSVDQGYEADLYSVGSDSVEVNIRISDLGNVRINCLAFQTGWDNSKLEMTSCKVYKLSYYDTEGTLGTLGAVYNVYDKDENFVAYPNYSEACNFSYAYASTFGSFTNENGILTTIRFKVKDNVELGEKIPISLSISQFGFVTHEEIPVDLNSYTFEANVGYVIEGTNPTVDLKDEISRCTQIMDSINVCNECYSLPINSLWLTEEEAESNRQAIAVAQAVVDNSDATKEEIGAALQALIDTFIEPRKSDQRYEFTIENDEATITEYSGTVPEPTIPASLGGYPVTCIGKNAFQWCGRLTSVVIPDSVVSIGQEAFRSCSSLSSVYIGKSVTSIGKYAFAYCKSLTDIVVDNDNPIYKSIDGALFKKDGTELIQYPIGRAVVSYTIPDSVTSIGDKAFSQCSSLTSAVIPDSVTSIGYGAFSQCSSLTGVVIPDSVTNVGSGAFFSCDNLKNVTIGHSVEGIGRDAFASCGSLTSVVIPDSVTSIGWCAFEFCRSLTDVTIPNNVTSIGYNAFEFTKWLDNQTDTFVIVGDSVLIKYNGKEKIVTIPPSVKCLSDAFAWNDNLRCVIIPDSVTRIEAFAFEYSESLHSIFFKGPKINDIQISAFYQGGGEGYSSIEATLYYSPDYASSWAPNGETSSDGLPLKPCDNLPVDNGIYGYIVNDEETTIISYSGVDKEVTIPDELGNHPVTCIAANAFSGSFPLCVTIPDSVTSIDDAAFYGCSTLIAIAMPDNVTSIGRDTFYGCSALVGVTIPDSVTSIGKNTFYGCSALKNVTIPDSVKSIQNQAFYGCSALKSMIIPDSVEEICSYAFMDCSSLKSVLFEGAPPTKFGYYVFPASQALLYLSTYAKDWAPNGETTWNGYPIVMIPVVATTTASGEAVNAVIQEDSETHTLSNIPAGTTAEQLFQALGESATGTTHELKTGDTINLDGVEYTIAVAGDLDCNGDITSADAAKLLRAIVKFDSLTPIQQVAANLRDNESFSASDAARILRWIVKLEQNLVTVSG